MVPTWVVATLPDVEYNAHCTRAGARQYETAELLMPPERICDLLVRGVRVDHSADEIEVSVYLDGYWRTV